MPDDWETTQLGNAVNISTKSFNPVKNPDVLLEHYSIPAYDETLFPVMEYASSVKSNKFIIEKGCFLVSKLNPTIRRIWMPYCLTPHAVCSTEFIVYKAKKHELTDFLYSLVYSESFFDFMCSHVTGSTGSRQRTTPSETLNFEFTLPDTDTIEAYTDIAHPIYEQIQNNTLQSQHLSALRDALLPRLMSGELDVSDVEI